MRMRRRKHHRHCKWSHYGIKRFHVKFFLRHHSFFCSFYFSSIKRETFLLRRWWWHNNKELLLRRFLINKVRRSSLLGWRLHLVCRCVGGCPRAACGLVASYCHWMRRDNELGRTLLSRNNTYNKVEKVNSDKRDFQLV